MQKFTAVFVLLVKEMIKYPFGRVRKGEQTHLISEVVKKIRNTTASLIYKSNWKNRKGYNLRSYIIM